MSNKLYCWFNSEIRNGHPVCVADYYTIDENKCKSLVELHLGSEYYQVELEELLDLDCEKLDDKYNYELKGCIVEYGGQEYQYINNYATDEEGDIVVFVPVDEAHKYTKKCQHCGRVMHENFEDMVVIKDVAYCEDCGEYVCQICGKYIEDDDEERIHYNENWWDNNNYHRNCFKKAVSDGTLKITDPELTKWLEIIMES